MSPRSLPRCSLLLPLRRRRSSAMLRPSAGQQGWESHRCHCLPCNASRHLACPVAAWPLCCAEVMAATPRCCVASSAAHPVQRSIEAARAKPLIARRLPHISAPSSATPLGGHSCCCPTRAPRARHRAAPRVNNNVRTRCIVPHPPHATAGCPYSAAARARVRPTPASLLRQALVAT